MALFLFAVFACRRGQFGERRAVYELFFREPQWTHQTFLEIGAYDGTDSTNTQWCAALLRCGLCQ